MSKLIRRKLPISIDLSKVRSPNPSIVFPPISENGKPLCRYCKTILTGRRRSWCSDKCMEEALIICMTSFARMAVYKRDHGICAECGCDTEKLRKEFYKNYGTLYMNKQYTEANIYLYNKKLEGWPVDRYNTRSWWEADHIVAVVEGGGCCGLDNYRTLCVPCHKKDTRLLRKRLAQERKGGKK